MTSIQQSFVVLMLAALVPLTSVDACYPAPGASADVVPRQSTDEPAEETILDEEDEEDEEPDCE